MSNDPRREASGEDAALASAWRAASRDEPPAGVDAAILAAARAELRGHAAAGQARRAWWSSWQPLAAAAGVAGLAFVLVQTLPEHAAPRAPAVSEQSATAASGSPPPEADTAVVAEPPNAAKTAPAPPEPPAPAQRARSRPEARPEARAEGEAAEATAPAFTSPLPAATADRRAARAVTERQAAAASSLEESAMGAGEPPSPEGWVERILASYEAGDLPGAEAQLEDFRRAYPDADRHLPDRLRDWAASVPMRAGNGPP